MMLFKLSLKNIQKSMKDYAIYFFTLILGVAVFYIFNSIDSQAVMLNVSSSTYEIIRLMTQILSGVSVFVAVILAALIIYACRFLTKRRNKEFGVYMTLGMSKRKISLILFFETLFIGIISLGVGLVAGIFLSQLMSIVIANMFEADLSRFEFVFSSEACIKTLIYFGIMYIIVIALNTINVSRCKLLDLLYANKKSEQVKLKNPWLCTLIFAVSCIGLGYAYYIVTERVDILTDTKQIFIPIILGAVTTFLIFWSLSGLILKIVRSNKRFYYRGLNSFTVRQISSKINTTVLSMTIICLMLFVTICTLSSALSMKNSLTDNLKKLCPADVELQKRINIPDASGKYTQAQIEDSRISIRQNIDEKGFDIDKNFKDIVEFNLYETEELTLEKNLGEYINIIKYEYPYLHYDTKETIMRLSDYNRMAEIFNLKKQKLADDEYIIVCNFSGWSDIYNVALKENAHIMLNGKEYSSKYQKCQDGFYYMNASYSNMGFVVVPDDAVSDDEKCQEVLIANYRAGDEKGRKAIDDDFTARFEDTSEESTTLEAVTKIYLYEASVGLGAMVTFIGLYLGIIFLISCAAVLALKELSESSDNIEKYKMLRKIGVDEKMINKALFMQIGIFFVFPLIIAVIHSIFGIKFCNYILSTVGNTGLLAPIVTTAAFIVLIYGGYFIVTYICSKNIIKEH